jgi:hypothetical protein
MSRLGPLVTARLKGDWGLDGSKADSHLKIVQNIPSERLAPPEKFPANLGERWARRSRPVPRNRCTAAVSSSLNASILAAHELLASLPRLVSPWEQLASTATMPMRNVGASYWPQAGSGLPVSPRCPQSICYLERPSLSRTETGHAPCHLWIGYVTAAASPASCTYRRLMI